MPTDDLKRVARESSRLRQNMGNRVSDEELDRGLKVAQSATPAPWALRFSTADRFNPNDVGLHHAGHENVLGEFYSEFVKAGFQQPTKARANAVFTSWMREHGIPLIQELQRARAALQEIIDNAPDDEPDVEDYDDTESASLRGIEVGAWGIAQIARKAMRHG